MDCKHGFRFAFGCHDCTREYTDAAAERVRVEAELARVGPVVAAAEALVEYHRDPMVCSPPPMTGELLQVLAEKLKEAQAIASCPGRELESNPCRCPCDGCKHHCSAHDPADVEVSPVSDAPAAPEETELILDLTRADHPYSRSLLGDWCSMCGDPATHKVGEEDVTRQFHNLTNYLCCLHFTVAIGDCDLFPYGHGREVAEVDYGKEVADDV